MTSIPEISACGSLILWAKFQIPVGPRSGREGEKCRPLDHIRQIPYVHPALFLSYTGIIFCIYAKDFHRFHPYGNHIASWYNVDLSFTHALLQNHLLRNHLLMSDGVQEIPWPWESSWCWRTPSRTQGLRNAVYDKLRRAWAEKFHTVENNEEIGSALVAHTFVIMRMYLKIWIKHKCMNFNWLKEISKEISK